MKKKPSKNKPQGYKQLTIDVSAWEILIAAKDIAVKEGVSHPSFSDAIRAMKRRLDE